jgi:Family of unknown function (DUF5681)
MKRKPSRRAAEDAPYEIGYCKPPKHTRFKPGQSGHPSGRPRGQRNFRTAVREALKDKITIREGDRTRTVSKMDAIIQVTFNKALKGDAKALVAFLQLVRWAGLMDEQPELSSTESISAEDEAIVEGYLERHGLKQHKERTRRPKQKNSPTRQQRRKSPEDKT